MKTYRFNGESWYCDKRGVLKRLRQWLIWVGGAEIPNGEGWNFNALSPFPVSLFGHRITFYGWGLNIRVSRGLLVVVTQRGRFSAYISSDGTPSKSHHWIFGTPREVLCTQKEIPE